MIEETETEFMERFKSQKIQIEAKLEMQETALLESLQLAIETAFLEVSKQQNLQKKEAVQYISFAVLFSDMLLERYGFHIELYDVNLFLDESFTFGRWEIPDIYSYIQEDMEQIERSVKQKFTRVTKSELFELKSYYTIQYIGIEEAWLRKLVNQLTELDKKEADCMPSLQILFGLYMEGQEVLRTWEV